MPKVLIVGDSHWGISGNNQQMIEQNIKVWNYILEVARSNGCSDIIETGDFLDKRKEIDANLFDIINNNIISNLWKVKIDLHMIVGNHNLYFRDTSSVNNIKVFEGLSDFVHIIDKPTELYNIDLIPWVNKDNIEDITRFVQQSNNKYCIGHFEFSGFNFDKYREAEVTERISRSSFNKYKKVFSGHYHIRSEKDNVLYVGTPHQLTWVDEGVEKYIYMLDTETGDITEFIVPFKMFEQFELTVDDWLVHCNDDLKGKKVKILYEDDIDSKVFNDIQTRFIQINPDIQFIKKSSKKKLNDKVVLDEKVSLLDSILEYTNNIKPEHQDKVESLIKKVYNG